MSAQIALEVSAELGNLSHLLGQLDSFGESHAWSDEALFHVRLVVEELVMNVIHHGSTPGMPAPQVKLDVQQLAGLIHLKLSDDGQAFDPLARAAPDLESELKDRAVGGLGIHFLRTFMDSASYQREGRWNRLRFSKRVC